MAYINMLIKKHLLPIALVLSVVLQNFGKDESSTSYDWTTDHMQFGVRWQPFAGRPQNNLYDANRPVLSKYSSYAQFWINWAAA